ncbi:hypothetical protein BHE74_00028887 [Ensete ventricosum]|nr:hypothetical protein BHE74_00028887 [Ensete ventricosum]
MEGDGCQRLFCSGLELTTGDGAVAGEATERIKQLHQWRSSSAPRAASPDGEEGTGGILAVVVPHEDDAVENSPRVHRELTEGIGCLPRWRKGVRRKKIETHRKSVGGSRNVCREFLSSSIRAVFLVSHYSSAAIDPYCYRCHLHLLLPSSSAI